MKLVIDMQGAQTESRSRGIGRHTRHFATAVIEHAQAHDVHLVFNGGLRENLDDLLAQFMQLLPRDQIGMFQIPDRVREMEPDNLWRMRAAELAREAYLAESGADIVHVSSLFEGAGDDAVTSIGLMQAPHATSVTLFDLIPLYDPQLHLGAGFMRRFYFRRAQSLKRADLLLAISQSARREAIDMLQIPPGRIDVALLAADGGFRKLVLAPAEQNLLRKRYGLPRSFALYIGSIEARKNVGLIIEAFGKLPSAVQERHALVFGGKLNEPEQRQLRVAAARFGVDQSRLVLPGYIEERDLTPLLNMCALFVFPSVHEGFGLPPLEAMACGVPVLVARNSSLPEVVGRDDLMFGTHDADELATKMQRILGDPAYARKLRRWGPERAAGFSWQETGRRAVESLEALHERHRHTEASHHTFRRKPRLAFVSPLPADRSGVADSSADLLRELGRFYDVECVVHETSVDEPWILANFPIRDVAFFRNHANSYDRIVYAFGNSSFHAHMFDLLAGFPGVVILHDFFLSGVLAWMGDVGQRSPEDFLRELYITHGLPALDYAANAGRAAAALRYPANHAVFGHALGVIVHSRWAIRRAREVFGAAIADKMVNLPLLRAVVPTRDRKAARRRLAIADQAFVVCSFGFVAQTKMSERLLDAWGMSRAGRDGTSKLIFVGEHPAGEWGTTLRESIDAARGTPNVEITGYVEQAVYRDFLAAADLAVQLRTGSRGETSAAVMDCMAAGVAVIVNAHGTAAELADAAVMKLPDQVSTAQLAAAIDTLHDDAALRTQLGTRGRCEVLRHHHPAAVGESVRDAIEQFSTMSPGARQRGLLETLRELYAPVYPGAQDFAALATVIASQQPRTGPRRILYDITLLAESDLHTGIERVVRSMLVQFIRDPPAGYHVEPVRIDADGLRFARQCLAAKLGIAADVLPDNPVDFDRGDIYVMLEWAADRLPDIADWLRQFRRRGGRVVIGIHDLLPLRMPQVFPPHIEGVAQRWFEAALTVADQFLCISRCVADDVLRFGAAVPRRRPTPICVDWYRIASDISGSLPTKGLPSDAGRILGEMQRRMTFLMVGTVEPRKGHMQTLQAFHTLWARGADVNLIVVGRRGWMMEGVERLITKSAELARRLFWFSDVSDEFLELLYGNATALIAASLAEGFGLPLVEAASRNLPLIVRDIAVFHEVAGEHAFYFASDTPDGLADAVETWMALARDGRAPDPSGIAQLTWAESAGQFFQAVFSDSHYGVIPGAS
jgi:glycosyltransferase involved in cell wall biosynthesis